MPGLRLAVVGKGGAGKSFITATIARLLAQQGRRVLLLDSDALPGAAISLGLGPIETPMLNDAAEETVNGWRLKKGIGAATAVRRYSQVGPDGVRLLQYGKAGSEGLKGMWGSIHAFNKVVRRLATDGVLADWDILGDLAAGSRQIGQNNAPYASLYLVVVGPGATSRLTAKRLIAMARERGAEVWLIANRTTDMDVLAALIAPIVCMIPDDPGVRNADAVGDAPLDIAPDGPAVTAIRQLVDRLIGYSEHQEAS